MGYFSQLDNQLRERGIVTPALRYARRPYRTAAPVECYWRTKLGVVCVSCSDSEDRTRPLQMRGDERCVICHARIDGR